MRRSRRTRQAMQLSRGLVLGHLLTRLRHFGMGFCAMSVISLTLTGHYPLAVLMVCSVYVLSKVWDALKGLVTGRAV